MRPNECMGGTGFPCLDVRHERYAIPAIDCAHYGASVQRGRGQNR
jgi:hypothetical protein